MSREERTSREKAQTKTNLGHSCCSHPSVVILTLVQSGETESCSFRSPKFDYPSRTPV